MGIVGVATGLEDAQMGPPEARRISPEFVGWSSYPQDGSAQTTTRMSESAAPERLRIGSSRARSYTDPEMASDETDRLFIARPSDFVGERKILVKTLKATGRRQEAASIEKLPRPSLSTWATNQLARREPGLVKELGEVTARLQTAGSAPDYAGAVAQHRDLLRSLRARAEEILTEAGLRP